MEETKSGMGWAGLLLFFVVIWILFGAFSGDRGGYGRGGDNCGCTRVSNCEVEKQGIIDSAQTRFLIEKTSNDNREAIMAQNSRIYEQGLQERIFDLKLENMTLKNEANADARFNALSRQYEACCCEFNRRLDGIECNMLKRPYLSGIGVTCSGQIVPPVNA